MRSYRSMYSYSPILHRAVDANRARRQRSGSTYSTRCG